MIPFVVVDPAAPSALPTLNSWTWFTETARTRCRRGAHGRDIYGIWAGSVYRLCQRNSPPPRCHSRRLPHGLRPGTRRIRARDASQKSQRHSRAAISTPTSSILRPPRAAAAAGFIDHLGPIKRRRRKPELIGRRTNPGAGYGSSSLSGPCELGSRPTKPYPSVLAKRAMSRQDIWRQPRHDRGRWPPRGGGLSQTLDVGW
jgi:hypothetical protein